MWNYLPGGYQHGGFRVQVRDLDENPAVALKLVAAGGLQAAVEPLSQVGALPDHELGEPPDPGAAAQGRLHDDASALTLRKPSELS